MSPNRDQILSLRAELDAQFNNEILRVLFDTHLQDLEGKANWSERAPPCPATAREIAFELRRRKEARKGTPSALPPEEKLQEELDKIPDTELAAIRVKIDYLRDIQLARLRRSRLPFDVAISRGTKRHFGHERRGYQLKFTPRVLDPEEALRHFWRRYFDASDGDNLVVFTEPLFFRDEHLTYIRNIYCNDRHNPGALARFGIEDTGKLQPSYHYLATGEVMGVLDVFSLFQKKKVGIMFGTVRVDTKIDRRYRINDTNIILLGSARTNPIIEHRQGPCGYRLTDDAIEVLRPQAPHEQGIYKDSWGGTDSPSFYKYAILTRMPNLNAGYVVAMIAANHGRAAEGRGAAADVALAAPAVALPGSPAPPLRPRRREPGGPRVPGSDHAEVHRGQEHRDRRHVPGAAGPLKEERCREP